MLKAHCHFQQHMTYLSSFRTFAGEQFHRACRRSEKHQLQPSISVQNCHPASCTSGCQAAALPAPMALRSRKPEQQAVIIVFLGACCFHQVPLISPPLTHSPCSPTFYIDLVLFILYFTGSSENPKLRIVVLLFSFHKYPPLKSNTG